MVEAKGILVGACAVALLVSGGQAWAQGGGIPDRKEIEKRVREAFPKVMEQSPEETLEIEGVVKVTYKKLPTDPKKIASALGKAVGEDMGLPPGIDLNQYIGMFEPQLTELLNEFLQDVGKFEALKPIQVKSKTIPAGEHRIGLVFEGERPVAVRIFNKDEEKMKKPIDVRLKTRSVDLQEALKIELKEPKKQKEGAEKFELYLNFLRFAAKSSAKLEVDD